MANGLHRRCRRRHHAGVERRSPTPGGVWWTARHGSVVATAYDITTSDGLNSKQVLAKILDTALTQHPRSDRGGTRRSETLSR
jgi:penicillin V acylase-like amidase (Ntn superfamily)